MRISDWSSDVCSSDLTGERTRQPVAIFFPFFRGADRGCGGRWYRNPHRTTSDGFAMPGHHISDQPVFLFITHRRQPNQPLPAAHACIRARTAPTIENNPKLTSHPNENHTPPHRTN